MGRKQGESHREYKARMIDPVSESFCGAKWYNATIWLGSGMTTSCHHPLPHKVSVEDVIANPKALHNTPQKKEERRQMQCGERPKGCEYCWKVEDIGRDNISDRVYKSFIYEDNALQASFQFAGELTDRIHAGDHSNWRLPQRAQRLHCTYSDLMCVDRHERVASRICLDSSANGEY